MVRRLSVAVLVLSLLPTSAAAQSLTAALNREAKAIAERSTQPVANKNPYKTPAIALMAGGAGLLVLGLMQDRGAEVSTGGSNVSVKETGGSKTALTVLGAAAAASGVGLWFWGENKKARPAISFTPTKFQVGFRF